MKNSITLFLCLIFSFALAGEILTCFSKKDKEATKNYLMDNDDKSEKEKSNEEDGNTYSSFYIHTRTNKLALPLSIVIKNSPFQILIATSAYKNIVYTPPETKI